MHSANKTSTSLNILSAGVPKEATERSESISDTETTVQGYLVCKELKSLNVETICM